MNIHKYKEMLEMLVKICKATNLYHTKIHIQNMTKHIIIQQRSITLPSYEWILFRTRTVQKHHMHMYFRPQPFSYKCQYKLLPIHNDSSSIGEYSTRWTTVKYIMANMHKVCHTSNDVEWWIVWEVIYKWAYIPSNRRVWLDSRGKKNKEGIVL